MATVDRRIGTTLRVAPLFVTFMSVIVSARHIGYVVNLWHF
jgi:hypothetical protein